MQDQARSHSQGDKKGSKSFGGKPSAGRKAGATSAGRKTFSAKSNGGWSDEGKPRAGKSGAGKSRAGSADKQTGAYVQPHLRNAKRPSKPPTVRGARAKQYIDPQKFVCAAKLVEVAEYVPTHNFKDFALHASLLANIAEKGFTQPTAIQDQVIPLILQGKDVVGLANTGTGKTAAFALPMIQHLITHMESRALLMAPTRELAQQIYDECLDFAKGCGLRQALLIGGASMNTQIRDLRRNARIVVGTPGRIKDHLKQKTFSLADFDYTVLDEVDRMLDMGFLNDVSAILSGAKAERRSLFFSATMEAHVADLIKRYGNKPEVVSTIMGSTVDAVDQNVIKFGNNADKLNKLHDLLISPECTKTIIFDDTKRAVEFLGRELHARGFKVDYIHGDKSQAQRQRAINRLKSGEINVLVATDVAARGIDVADVSHVVNYSVPFCYEDYVHRIGRTARAGKAGYARTFLPA
jgi:ATP-dependent RNA helicase RhlE